ncbi:MAG: cytochrome c3 family protein [Acidobacteria bacterium]|nr:cytochrome c3 family protein [Acidobacteriota bacterium]
MGLGLAMTLDAETFSHKRHDPLKLKCVVCHTGAEKGERASFPKAAQCMVCHNGAEWKAPEIPSQRVYQQRDFVVFSHARHVTAGKVMCATCHGEVAQADVVVLAVEHTMKSCMACHKERGASNACNVCHELGQ